MSWKFSKSHPVRNPETGDSPTSTSSYTTFCQKTLKRQRQSKESLLDSIIMRSPEPCIGDLMMESCFDAYQGLKHKKPSRKPMTVPVEHISPGPNCGTDCEDLATIGQK